MSNDPLSARVREIAKYTPEYSICDVPSESRLHELWVQALKFNNLYPDEVSTGITMPLPSYQEPPTYTHSPVRTDLLDRSLRDVADRYSKELEEELERCKYEDTLEIME